MKNESEDLREYIKSENLKCGDCIDYDICGHTPEHIAHPCFNPVMILQ